jgi:hypothetical protein
LNTSIRVIAGGDYYSNNPGSNIQLTMPTPTASNDYLNIEFVISYHASNASFSGSLTVTFPVTSNSFNQSPGSYVTYAWDSNSTTSYWTITNYYGTTSYAA